MHSSLSLTSSSRTFFHLSQLELCTHLNINSLLPLLPALETPILLSVSMNLTLLGTAYKWNHTVFVFCGQYALTKTQTPPRPDRTKLGRCLNHLPCPSWSCLPSHTAELQDRCIGAGSQSSLLPPTPTQGVPELLMFRESQLASWSRDADNCFYVQRAHH